MGRKIPDQYKRARKTAGYTQRQASEYLGVNLSILARIEAGIYAAPLSMRQRMARWYGVSLHYLETGEPQTGIDHLADTWRAGQGTE